jgi:hypothetical protein
MTLTELAQRFRELKDRKDSLNAELKELQEELSRLETELLPQKMEENEIEKFTTDGVGTIFTQVKVYASVVKADETSLHNWLRDQGHGALIKETVAPGTLNSFVKEQLEQGTDLPEFIKATKIETAMLRRK